MKKLDYEVLAVAIVTAIFASAGWYSLIDRSELIEGIYKTNDPGAGLLPLILLLILSVSSVAFLIHLKRKRSISLNQIFHSTKLPLIICTLLIFSVTLSIYFGYLIVINGLTVVWFLFIGKIKKENSKKLVINLIVMLIITNSIIYLFFMKLLNTPLP
jgi:hypothetical protein